MQVRSLGLEDPLEEGMMIHCSTLTWRIPWKRNLTVHRITQVCTRLKQLSMHAGNHEIFFYVCDSLSVL